MTLEECRLEMIAHHEALIDEAVRTVRNNLQKQGCDADPDLLRKMFHDSIEKALPRETRLFLMPTAGKAC